MKVLRASRDINYISGTLRKGEIVFANEDNRIVQGPFMNRILAGLDCEVMDVVGMNQELLQRREEVKQLMIERDGYLKTIESTGASFLAQVNANLCDRNRKLSGEVSDLELQLDRVRNGKPEKVVLPKEVAIALDTLKKCGYTVSGVMHYQKNHKEADDCHDELRVIRNYVCIDGYRKDGLSYADGVTIGIVNGYTIEEPEQTDEDKFKKGFHHLYQRISVEDSSLNAEKRRAKLADHLNTLAKEIYSKS